MPYLPHGISSSVSPAANIADTRAIGKPVALLARAEDLEVRGLISITMILSVTGSCANWTFVPPITSMDSTILYACSCKRFWRSSEMVSMGAAQKESPVCTPRGSMFSMKHTVIMLFLASRTTSNSSSSQPRIDSSTSTCPTKEACKPLAQTVFSSSLLYTSPPPAPPMVYAGRSTTG